MASKDDKSAKFAIALADETSGPATNAATALKQLKGKIDADVKALREMQAALSRLKGGTTSSTKQFKELRDRITAQKASIVSAQARFLSLGGAFGATGSQAKTLGESFNGLISNAQRMPGPVGAIAGQFSRIAELVGGGGIVGGILAIAAALVALTTAALGVTIALLKYAVAQSDARRSELLRLESLTKLRRWHGLVAGSATEMQSAIDRVSDATSLGRGDVERYTAQLYRMGLRGENLNQALEGTVITAQVLGSGRANWFAGMAAGAIRTGRSVRKLADDVRARLGGIARRQMLSLDVQSEKLHERIARIFSGVRIEGFLSSLNEVTSMFSQSQATGRALKALVEGLFNPIFDSTGRASPIVKRFLQGITIGLLHLGIIILQVRNYLRQTFGNSRFFAGLDAGTIAVGAGIAVVGALATAFLVLAGVVTLVGAGFIGVVGPFVAAGAALIAFGVYVKGVVERIASTDWRALGASIWRGLVDGLLSGKDAIVSSMRTLAGGAQQAFRSALQIHSPSGVFAALGTQIPRGVAAGIDAGSSTSTHAVESMSAGVVGAGGALANGGARPSVVIEQLIVNSAAADATGIVDDIKDKLAEVLEGLALQIGAPREPAT